MNAIYEIEGFWHAAEVMKAPSVKKRFGTSCAWHHLFNTELSVSYTHLTLPTNREV